MKESNIQRLIMLAVSKAGATVFRNNVAQAWVGNSIKIQKAGMFPVEPGDVVIKQARPLHAGLVKGSSDLIGIDHATGRFLALEVKTQKGKVDEHQRNFLDRIIQFGGIAGVARSPQDAVEIIESARIKK